MSLTVKKYYQLPFTRNALSLGVALIISQMAFSGSIVAEEAEERSLGTITVTATKRAANIQDVPISIRAIGEEELKDMGADDFSSYANTIPGVNFQNRGPGRNKLVIRGISPSVGTSAATVGVYIDDMPVADQLSNPDLKMFDIDRVEVLRGPQGTLYGEGSMGGTVKLITNQPDVSEFAGRVEATYGNITDGGNEKLLNGMLNIPLIEDELALRLVAYDRDSEGWIDNINASNSEEKINDEQTDGYRAALKWLATDELSVSLLAIHQDTAVGGQNADGSYGNVIDFLAPMGVSTIPLAVGTNEIDQPLDEIIEDDFDRYNLTIEYQLPSATLTSVSSFFDRERAQTTNNPAIAAGRGLLEGHTLVAATTDTFTQEIRLVSNTDSALKWTVGAFYKDSERTETQFDQSDVMIDTNTYIGSLMTTGVGVVVPGAMSSLIVDTQIDIKQTAIFADLTYEFSDLWSASFGLRYFEEEQESIASLAGSIGFSANGVLPMFGAPFDPAVLGLGLAVDVNGLVSNGSFQQDDDAFNPRFNLSYTPDDDTLIYGTISQGFRSGGVNVFAHAQLLAPALGLAFPISIQPSYKSDSLWNYELGYKSTSVDGRLRFNGAIYYQDWSDVQVAEVSNGAFVIVNGGDAHSTGAEAELSFLATDNLQISVAGSVVNAEFDEDLATGAFSEGDNLPDVPGHNYSIAATYFFELSDNLLGDFRLDYSGVDSRSLITPALDGNTEIEGYETLNLRLGIDGDSWYASLFINNATDEVANLSAEFQRGGYYHNKPQTIGLTIGINF